MSLVIAITMDSFIFEQQAFSIRVNVFRSFRRFNNILLGLRLIIVRIPFIFPTAIKVIILWIVVLVVLTVVIDIINVSVMLIRIRILVSIRVRIETFASFW
jgi:hypothetical protein